jgi:hypothetical protein
VNVQKPKGLTAALAAREPLEADRLGGAIGSESKTITAQNQAPETAIAHALRLALEKREAHR